jgi:sulfite oxidase
MLSRSLGSQGYAYSGGGRRIIRVDVSVDGGDTWRAATITHQDKDLKNEYNGCWSWTLWAASVPIPHDKLPPHGKVQLVCKAVDSAYNSQPAFTKDIWNFCGVLANAYHRVDVVISEDDRIVQD